MLANLLFVALATLPLSLALGPLLSTITYGDTRNAIFTVFSQTLIEASPRTVFNIITNFTNYDKWNTFVTHVAYDGPLQVGTHMTFTNALLIPGTTVQSAEVFTSYDASALITSWRFDNTSAGTYAEHITQISTFGPGTSLYLSWETYYGPGAAAILAALGIQLQNAFKQQGVDLKAYAESQG